MDECADDEVVEHEQDAHGMERHLTLHSRCLAANGAGGAGGGGVQWWQDEGTGLHRLEQAGVRISFSSNAGDVSDAMERNGLSPHTAEAVTSLKGPAPTAADSKGSEVRPASASAGAAAGAVAVVPENPIMGESFAQKADRMRAKSPFGNIPGWGLGGLIAKSNDDVRQEVRSRFSPFLKTNFMFIRFVSLSKVHHTFHPLTPPPHRTHTQTLTHVTHSLKCVRYRMRFWLL